MLSREDNELLTRTGPGTPMGEYFRRFWLPALLASEVNRPDGPPVRTRLLGESLVAFRDSNGTLGVLEEHCPHRRCSLFFGRNENAGITCVYHGWRFDTQGNCLDIPTEGPDFAYKNKVKAKSYPTAEWGGVVWVYMGPPDQRPDLPQLEWCTIPESHRHISRFIQDCNYAQALEGELDPAHLAFLHRSFEQPGVPRPPLMNTLTSQIAPHIVAKHTDYGVVCGARRENRGTGRDADGKYYWRVTHFVLPFHALVLPPWFGWPQTARCWVPMDDHQVCCFDLTYSLEAPITEKQKIMNVQGVLPREGTLRYDANKENDYFLDRNMQRGRNYSGLASIRLQDMAMTESMGSIVDRTREHLTPTDAPIIKMRAALLRRAKELAANGTHAAAATARGSRVRTLHIVSDESDFDALLAANANEWKPSDADRAQPAIAEAADHAQNV